MIASLSAVASNFGSNPLWFVTRSTGLVAFVLLSVAVGLGVLSTQRVATPRWPRFASQALHRNVSIMAMLFLIAHVTTTLLDTFVDISWWAAVVPFTSSYRTFYVGLGTVALDLLLILTATSLVRGVTGHRWWRLVHWSAYAAWPLALTHYLGAGTDGRATWSLVLALACLAVVFIAVLARLVGVRTEGPTRVIGGA